MKGEAAPPFIRHEDTGQDASKLIACYAFQHWSDGETGMPSCLMMQLKKVVLQIRSDLCRQVDSLLCSSWHSVSMQLKQLLRCHMAADMPEL